MSLYSCAFIITYYLFGFTVISNYFTTAHSGEACNPQVVYSLNDGWPQIVDKLMNSGNKNILTIMEKYKEFSDRESIFGPRLRDQVIRHCIYRLIMNDFEHSESDLVQEAVKLDMMEFMERMKGEVTKGTQSKQNHDPTKQNLRIEKVLSMKRDGRPNPDESAVLKMNQDSTTSTNQNSIKVKIIAMQKNRCPDLDESGVLRMEQADEIVIGSRELEFIFLSTYDSRVAKFLYKLFLAMEKGTPEERKSNFQKILASDTQQVKESHKPVDVLPYFLGINGNLDKFIEQYPSGEMNTFLNSMISRHCLMYKLSKNVLNGAGVLGEARKLKKQDVLRKVNQFSVQGVFSTLEATEGPTPKTGTDLRRDKIFLKIREKNLLDKLKEEEINTIETILTLWILEETQMAYAGYQFHDSFQIIFDYIDKGNAGSQVEIVLDLIREGKLQNLF